MFLYIFLFFFLVELRPDFHLILHAYFLYLWFFWHRYVKKAGRALCICLNFFCRRFILYFFWLVKSFHIFEFLDSVSSLNFIGSFARTCPLLLYWRFLDGNSNSFLLFRATSLASDLLFEAVGIKLISYLIMPIFFRSPISLILKGRMLLLMLGMAMLFVLLCKFVRRRRSLWRRTTTWLWSFVETYRTLRLLGVSSLKIVNRFTSFIRMKLRLAWTSTKLVCFLSILFPCFSVKLFSIILHFSFSFFWPLILIITIEKFLIFFAQPVP